MALAQFSTLRPIGENILFFQPPARKSGPGPEQGATSNSSLITFCIWLGGATTQRIQKYITGYGDVLNGHTCSLIRYDMVIGDLRAQLNDPADFGSTAARLYLYSRADEVVGGRM